MSRRVFVIAAITLFFVTPGCGRGGIDRHDVYGRVEFQGNPVPYGRIAFRPDREKGGSGPAGFAEIIDGEYNTKSAGKGSVSGPVVVAIEGYQRKGPLAPPLFAPYLTAVEITDDSDELDFTVPETATPSWFRTNAKSDYQYQ